MVRHIPCRVFVNESERRAVEVLKTKLRSAPGHWVLLSNLSHAGHQGRRADEIDIVAIGPPGVATIEVKLSGIGEEGIFANLEVIPLSRDESHER